MVDLDFLFEFKFEVSSCNVRSNLVFLSLSDLSLNSGLETVEYFKEFFLNLNPSFSVTVLEVVKSKVSLVVVNVARTDFIS